MNPRITPLCNIRLEDGRDVIGAFMRSFTGRSDIPPHLAGPGLIANFPLARHWNSADERLATCHRDVPWNEPALVAAMLEPSWPDRQPLARALAAIRRLLGQDWREACLQDRSLQDPLTLLRSVKTMS